MEALTDKALDLNRNHISNGELNVILKITDLPEHAGLAGKVLVMDAMQL